MNATPLVIGHEPDFAPFALVEDGQARGMLIDILVEALGRAEIAHEFRAVDLDRLDIELALGNIDAIAFRAGTAERLRAMDLSDTLITTGAGLFARSDLALANVKTLAEAVIVTPRAGPLLNLVARRLPKARVVKVASYAEALAEVAAGSADAAALNFQAGIRMVRRDFAGRIACPSAPFFTLPLAFAVAKGRNGQVLGALNRALETMRSDGTMRRLVEAWMS